MKRILSLVAAVALVAALNTSAFAQSAEAMPATRNHNFVTATINPVTGEQTGQFIGGGAGTRQNGDVVYDNFDATNDLNFTRLQLNANTGATFADDVLCDKSKNPGAGLATLEGYFIAPGAAGTTYAVKLDVYAATFGPYNTTNLIPSVATKIGTAIFNLVNPAAGFSLWTLTVDFTNGGTSPLGLAKPDKLWVTMQEAHSGAATNRGGPILKRSLPIVGSDWIRAWQPTIPQNRGYFLINVNKDNDAAGGWGGFYSFGGPAAPYGGTANLGDFNWRLTNVPEPATMAFVGAAALAFFRRRR